jgi:hypothetical protein
MADDTGRTSFTGQPDPANASSDEGSHGLGAASTASQSGQDVRDEIVQAFALAISSAGRTAARTAALAGGLVQLAGLVMIFWALGQQELSTSDLRQSEFVTVIVVGAVLVGVGPLAGKAVTPAPPNEAELAEKALGAVDAREQAEQARRKAITSDP